MGVKVWASFLWLFIPFRTYSTLTAHIFPADHPHKPRIPIHPSAIRSPTLSFFSVFRLSYPIAFVASAPFVFGCFVVAFSRSSKLGTIFRRPTIQYQVR